MVGCGSCGFVGVVCFFMSLCLGGGGVVRLRIVSCAFMINLGICFVFVLFCSYPLGFVTLGGRAW